MKKLYQFCQTSHDEVMFRSEEDYGYYLNSLALASYQNDTEILVEAEMSTHAHGAIYSRNPVEFVRSNSQRYTTYFNRKYGREGPLRDARPYIMEVQGYNHARALITYILRNGIHHGVSATPWGYRNCTARELFCTDLGYRPEPAAQMTRGEIASMLPRHAEFPDEYQMNESGIFLRRSFMEIQKAEAYFVTPRSYLYNMNMITDERWLADQDNDMNGAERITLNSVERGFPEKSINEMLANEKGFKFDRNRILDLDLCKIIDKEMIGRFGATTIYDVSMDNRKRLLREIIYDLRVSEDRARRCLAIKE